MHKIYALIDPFSKQIRYIGVTKYSIKHRISGHFSSVEKGSKTYVHNWLRKINQKPVFKILEKVKRKDSARKAEQKWIAYYRKKGVRLTNLTDGGDGISGFKHSLKTKIEMSIKRKGQGKGRHLSIKTKLKLSKINKGKKIPESVKRKMSLGIKKFYRNHPEAKLRISKMLMGNDFRKRNR